MSTPIINSINNVNQASLETIFAAVAQSPEARDNLSQSDRNIDAVGSNPGVIRELNASEEAIRKILTRREGRDPANFPDLASVAGDVSLVRDLSVRETTTTIIANSEKASTALSGSDRAGREMMCFPAGLDATTFTSVDDVASDSAAMSTIAADAQAMRATVAVQLAIDAVAASQTAMDEIAASQTAMEEVANTRRAIDVVGSNTNEAITTNSLLNTTTARTELQGSKEVKRFEVNYGNGENAGGINITNSRVLVTSLNTANTENRGVEVSFNVDAGTKEQGDTAFIVNDAVTNNGDDPRGGGVGFSGIEIK